MLVQSQRSISCLVAPNTYPYRGVASSSFLELLQKKTERGLLRSTLIAAHLLHAVIPWGLLSWWQLPGSSLNKLPPCLPFSVLSFALSALMLLLLIPLLWIVLLLLQKHMWDPEWSWARLTLETRLQHLPLLMTLQRPPHPAVPDADSWPSTFMFGTFDHMVPIGHGTFSAKVPSQLWLRLAWNEGSFIWRTPRQMCKWGHSGRYWALAPPNLTLEAIKTNMLFDPAVSQMCSNFFQRHHKLSHYSNFSIPLFVD